MYAVPPSYGPPGGPLQRLSLGQLIDEALKLYRRHFLIFFIITLVMAIPGLLMTLAIYDFQSSFNQELQRLSALLQDPEAFQEQFPNPEVALRPFIEQSGSLMLLSLGIMVVNTFLFRTLTIGLTTAAVGIIYTGGTPTFEATFSRAFRRLGTLLSWGGLLAAIILAPFFLFGIGLSGGSIGIFICLMFFFIAWPFVSLAILARTIFGARAIVAEDLGVGAAWRRSQELSRGSALRIIGFALALAFGVGIVASIVNAVLGMLFPAPDLQSLTAPIPLLIASTIVGALVEPLVHIGLTLMYFDHRRVQDQPRPQGPYGQYMPPQEGL